MKVEFNDFVVKIKAQYKTEKENRTEKFLYHLLGVYADAQKTAIREQKFAIAQAYNKEIEGIRDAIHHEKTAREETEEKRRGVGFKIGDMVIIPQNKRKELEEWEWFIEFEKQFPDKKVYEISAKVGDAYRIKGDEWCFLFLGSQLKAYDEKEKSVIGDGERQTQDGGLLIAFRTEHGVQLHGFEGQGGTAVQREDRKVRCCRTQTVGRLGGLSDVHRGNG